MLKQLRHSLLVFLATLLGVMPAMSAANEGEAGLLMPRFKFQAQSAASLGADNQSAGISAQDLLPAGPVQSLQQYDATIYYPLGDTSFNVDVGLNIRYLDAYLNSAAGLENSRVLADTIPMVYAEALFDLPFKGLSASVGGQHLMDLRDHSLFDYSAKLSYRWDSGFGLQGGWKHQQYNLDSSTSATFERKGLFLDLDYRF